jgi:hypothetical protein
MNDETVDIGPVVIGDEIETPVAGGAPVDPNAGQRPLTAPRAKRLAHRLAAEAVQDAVHGHKHVFRSWFEALSLPNREAVVSALIELGGDHEVKSL